MDPCTDVVQNYAAGELLAAGDDGAQRAVLWVQLVLVQGDTRVTGERIEEVVQTQVHPEEGCQDPAEGNAPVADNFVLSECNSGLKVKSHKSVCVLRWFLK